MFIEGNPSINIDLEPGIYVLDGRSASGKTYLANLMERYRASNPMLRSYSYSDVLDDTSLCTKVKPQTKILLLDRYDMYYDKIDNNFLNNFVSNNRGIVIVDCKLLSNMRIEYKFGVLDFEEKGIVVHT